MPRFVYNILNISNIKILISYSYVSMYLPAYGDIVLVSFQKFS